MDKVKESFFVRNKFLIKEEKKRPGGGVGYQVAMGG